MGGGRAPGPGTPQPRALILSSPFSGSLSPPRPALALSLLISPVLRLHVLCFCHSASPASLSLRASAGVWSPSLLAAVWDPDTRARQPEPGRRGPGWAQSSRGSGPRRPRGRRAASPARDGVGRVRRRSGRGRTFRRGVLPVSSANCRGLPPLDRFPFAQRPELKASGPAGADDPDALRHLEHPGRRRPVHAAPSGQRCGRSRGPGVRTGGSAGSPRERGGRGEGCSPMTGS